MAKGVRTRQGAKKGVRTTRGATKTVPRRKRAVLEIEQPKEVATNDEYVRREALQFVVGINAGRTLTLSQILSDAKEVYDFVRGASAQPLALQEPVKLEASPFEPVPEENHRSKFEQISM